MLGLYLIIGVIKLARIKLRIITVSILVGLLMLPACSNKDKEAQKPQMSSQQKAKAPEEMKSIVTDLEMIISELEQKVKMSKASPLAQNTKIAAQSQQGQQNQQQGESQQGQQNQQGQQGQSQQTQQSQGGQSQSSQQNQMSAWQKEDTSIKNIHRNWNALEPEAIKAGLSTADRDSFEQALEKLTLAVSSQKKEESLTAAIEVYGKYANLVKTFNSAVPAEFYQLKYEVMIAADKAMKKEWTAAEEHIPKIEESWTNLKVKAEKQDGKSISRTDFSITDLKQALKTQQPDLLMIKAEIVMNNLQQMQKELSKSSGGTSS